MSVEETEVDKCGGRYVAQQGQQKQRKIDRGGRYMGQKGRQQKICGKKDMKGFGQAQWHRRTTERMSELEIQEQQGRRHEE